MVVVVVMVRVRYVITGAIVGEVQTARHQMAGGACGTRQVSTNTPEAGWQSSERAFYLDQKLHIPTYKKVLAQGPYRILKKIPNYWESNFL